MTIDRAKTIEMAQEAVNSEGYAFDPELDAPEWLGAFAALVRAEVMREMADSGHSTARAGEASTWQPFDTAPQDGEIFLALNHDREAWVATYITKEGPPRLAYRTNGLRESKRYRVHEIDGKRLMEELESSESWDSNWTYWSRGYEFKPTHWTPAGRPAL